MKEELKGQEASLVSYFDMSISAVSKLVTSGVKRTVFLVQHKNLFLLGPHIDS